MGQVFARFSPPCLPPLGQPQPGPEETGRVERAGKHRKEGCGMEGEMPSGLLVKTRCASHKPLILKNSRGILLRDAG